MSNQYSLYTKKDYTQGLPEYNLMRNSRRLIIKAVLKSNWDINKAFELNFGPRPTIKIDAYYKILKKHHISVKDKKITKFSEIN